MLAIPLLMGCAFMDWMLGTGAYEDPQATKEYVKGVQKQAEVEAGVDRADGNYKLTWSGEPPGPWAGSFDPINRTPAMLTATSLTASESNKFSVGDPRVAVQAKDTWKIDAKREGNRIVGTVEFVRWNDKATQVIVNDLDKGEERIEPYSGGTELTVKWVGDLKAVVADDGTIAGTVKGTFSNSEGFSTPFKWEFAGDPKP